MEGVVGNNGEIYRESYFNRDADVDKVREMYGLRKIKKVNRRCLRCDKKFEDDDMFFTCENCRGYGGRELLNI
jgi:rRNA maturation endonuclease Nob1